MTRHGLRVIVLAAQRQGVRDPLAARFGVSHKCLVPLHGQPLVAHVLGTLAACRAVDSVAISVEAGAFDPIRQLIPSASGKAFDLVAARDNITESVLAAAGDHSGPLVITTADNVLLSASSVVTMRKVLLDHDGAVAMARRESVLDAHPDGQRRFYRFRDGEYSNCNLYGLAHCRALRAAEIFRGGGQFAKKASRIVEAFGLANLVLLKLGLLSLPTAMRRISKRVGLDLAAVVLPDGRQAIDVDNDRTYAVVQELLESHPSGSEVVMATAEHRMLDQGQAVSA